MKSSGNQSRLVLVIDDEESTRYSLTWTLKEAGFRVIEAPSGRVGIQQLKHDPDLIILDVLLPDISGFEVCRWIKENPQTSSIPILHMSACYMSSEHKTQGLEWGADAYLVHPVEAPELLATVRALLRIRESEAKAKRAAHLWSVTFDALQDPVCLVNAYGIIVRCNKSFSKIFPKFREGQVFKELLPARQHAKEDVAIADRWYSVSESELTLGGYVCTFKDITDRRIAELGHMHAKSIAEAANQSKSLFLANMSHEIRTPLGVILGYASLLKEDKLGHAERDSFIDTIIRNGEALANLINDILDVSKIEAGKMGFESIPVDLHKLVQDVLESMYLNATSKALSLNLEWSPEVPEQILSDSARLRQILFNIVGNAVKFTDRGRIDVRVKKLDEGLVAIDVEDTGCGISEAHQKKLFAAFTQGDESTTRRFGGTGLGLVLSRKMAQGLGGDVVLLQSKPGVGSTYRITVSAAMPEERRTAVPPASENAGSLNKLRILIADDSPDNRYLLNRILTRRGASVHEVENGEEAVRQAHDYDLILMDMQMPVMDGYRAIEKLRHDHYEGKIIALTAHALQEEKDRVTAIGCNDYLTKPIDTKALLASIARNMHIYVPDAQARG